MRHRHTFWIALGLLAANGCFWQPRDIKLRDEQLEYYREVMGEPSEPHVDAASSREAQLIAAGDPWVIDNPAELPAREIDLEEAIRLAIENSQIIRNLGGTVVASPAGSPTVFDPSLAFTDANRSVEAALSAFDAQLSANLFWQKNERVVNQSFPGLFPPTFNQTTANFTGELSKVTANGSRLALRHNIGYDRNSNLSLRFPSSYNVNYEAEWRQPLLQGAGVQFNRIAGPNGSPGGSGGVLVARINEDISLVDFETAIINLVDDVETAYWDLYNAYRNLNALLAGRDSALVTWQSIAERARLGLRGGEPENEAQARTQYFIFEGRVQDSLGGQTGLFAREQRLRYLLGLAPKDEQGLLRPSSEPATTRYLFDWSDILTESFARRVELRRQKWQIKRSELELIAARNYLLPNLDVVSLYRWRGFGDDLIGSRGAPNDNAYADLTGGDFQEWQLGLEFRMPIGYRRQMANVRNAQITLTRNQALYEEQELAIAHELGNALRELQRAYELIQTNYNRRAAAFNETEAFRARYDVGFVELNIWLQALQRLSDADSAYYQSIVDYNLAIKEIHKRKGSLLEYNGVQLTEAGWSPQALADARRRAEHFTPHWIGGTQRQPTPITAGPLQQFSRQPEVMPGHPVPGHPADGNLPGPDVPHSDVPHSDVPHSDVPSRDILPLPDPLR